MLEKACRESVLGLLLLFHLLKIMAPGHGYLMRLVIPVGDEVDLAVLDAILVEVFRDTHVIQAVFGELRHLAVTKKLDRVPNLLQLHLPSKVLLCYPKESI